MPSNINMQRKGLKELVKTAFSKKIAGVLSALIAITIFSSILSPHFLTSYNITIIIRELAFIGIVTLGQTMVLLTGEIDLSVGAVAGFCSVMAGKLMVELNVSPLLSIILALILGSLCGLINGLLVTKLKLNALVVTLGTMGVYSGLNLVITKGKSITDIPAHIYFLGQGMLLEIPFPLYIMLAILIVLTFTAYSTTYGRHLYATGSNIEAAEIVGLRVDAIKIGAFIISSLLATIAGILMIARLGSAQPAIGQAWLLPSIAAAVIGGTALTGGEGIPLGSILGAAIIGVIENTIVLLGVSPYWQTVVSGSVVVAAVSIDSMRRMIAGKK